MAFVFLMHTAAIVSVDVNVNVFLDENPKDTKIFWTQDQDQKTLDP